MFPQAVRYEHYTCYLGPQTRLDMMYMPDAIRAIIELMDTDASRLRYRNATNVTAMSFTPAELPMRSASISRPSPSTTRSIPWTVDCRLLAAFARMTVPRAKTGIGRRGSISRR